MSRGLNEKPVAVEVCLAFWVWKWKWPALVFGGKVRPSVETWKIPGAKLSSGKTLTEEQIDVSKKEAQRHKKWRKASSPDGVQRAQAIVSVFQARHKCEWNWIFSPLLDLISSPFCVGQFNFYLCQRRPVRPEVPDLTLDNCRPVSGDACCDDYDSCLCLKNGSECGDHPHCLCHCNLHKGINPFAPYVVEWA